MPHTLKWFKTHIGQKLFREATSCPCIVCKDVVENGIVVKDENHAQYIFDEQNEQQIEYRDRK